MGNSGACAIFEIQVQSDQTRGGESIVGRYRSIPRYQSARREVFANNGCLYRDCAGERYASLSRREREVMGLVVSGRLNTEVGGELGISEIRSFLSAVHS